MKSEFTCTGEGRKLGQRKSKAKIVLARKKYRRAICIITWSNCQHLLDCLWLQSQGVHVCFKLLFKTPYYQCGHLLWQLIKSINPIGRESWIIIPDNNLLLKWLFFVQLFPRKKKNIFAFITYEKRSGNIIYGSKFRPL